MLCSQVTVCQYRHSLQVYLVEMKAQFLSLKLYIMVRKSSLSHFCVDLCNSNAGNTRGFSGGFDVNIQKC